MTETDDVLFSPDHLAVHPGGEGGAGLEPGEAAAAVSEAKLHHRLHLSHPTLCA